MGLFLAMAFGHVCLTNISHFYYNNLYLPLDHLIISKSVTS